ncbi:hypothetical protein [Mumia quercus]|uniref:hypothetical protein n=1 Tax=Mumia quercus TaxID=2976125 RepID=UPI0021D29774|nr:hypothetical protein [Mumia quercus]
MTKSRTTAVVVAAAVGGLLLGGTATAVAVSSAKTVKVCTTSKGVVRSADAKGKCPRKTSKKAVAVRGPAGPRGATGTRGATGPRGPGAVALSAVHPTDAQWRTVKTPVGSISTYCAGGSIQAGPVFAGGFATSGTSSIDDAGVLVPWNSYDGVGNISRVAGSRITYDGLVVDLKTGRTEALHFVYLKRGDGCVLFGQATPSG